MVRTLKENTECLLRRLIGRWVLSLDVKEHPDPLQRIYHIQEIQEVADDVFASGYNVATNEPVYVNFAPTPNGTQYLFSFLETEDTEHGLTIYTYWFNQRERFMSGEFLVTVDREVLLTGTFMGRRSEKDTPT